MMTWTVASRSTTATAQPATRGRTCVVDLEMYPDYYYCECDPGTVEVDGDCVADPCLDIQCGDNATCDPYERACFCDDFYEGDPDAGCTPIIDYCAMAAQEYDFTCGTNSLCVFDPTSGGADYGMPITCVCEDEYVFDGSEANQFLRHRWRRLRRLHDRSLRGCHLRHERHLRPVFRRVCLRRRLRRRSRRDVRCGSLL